MENKESHSKVKDLFYSQLKVQEYLGGNQLTAIQAQAVFSYRTRMAQYSENYQNNSGHSPCPLCLSHLDSQSFSFSCPEIKNNVNIRGKYTDLFNDRITTDLADTLLEIDRFKLEHENSRMIQE